MKNLIITLLAFSCSFVFGATTYYVAPTEGGATGVVGSDSAETSGTDKSAPFATITNAIAKAEASDTVMLLKGTHKITSNIDVNKAITVCGEGRNDEVIIDGQEKGTSISVSKDGTLLHSFSFINMFNSKSAGAIKLTSASVVSNLVARNNNVRGARFPIYATKGLVTHCWVTNNMAAQTGCYVSGPVILENCYFANNTNTTYNSGWRGIVFVYNNSNPIVRNCTIVNNVTHTYGALSIRKSGGKIYNNIIYGNTDYATGNELNWKKYDTGEPIYYGNCTTPLMGTEENGNVDKDPLLSDDVMHFLKASPCYQSAVKADANGNEIIVPEYDINGVARGDRPSIGAFEYVEGSLLSCLIDADKDNALLPEKINLSVIMEGSYTEPLSYEWDFNADGIADSNLSNPSLSEVGVYTVSLKVTDNAGKSCSASFGKELIVYSGNGDVYVTSKESQNAMPPYCSWDTAATNIHDAVKCALEGRNVYLDDGTHVIESTVEVFKGVCVVGINGAERTFIAQKNKNTGIRFFNMNDSAAALRGVTICGAKGKDNASGSLIELSKGSIKDCKFYNNTTAGNQDWGLVHSGNANNVIEHCVFYGNYCGPSVLLEYGTLKNSLFYGNTNMTTKPYTLGGAVRCRKEIGSPKIYNLTVVNNVNVVKDKILPAGIYNENGVGYVRNCVSVGNLAYDSGTKQYVDANDIGIAQGVSDTKLSHSLMYPYSGNIDGYTGLLIADPAFKNGLSGDYRLMSASPCVNAGTNLSYTVSDLDLSGKKRINKKIVDMGCYENQSLDGMRVIIR